MFIAGFGAFFFGLLLGWILYRTLRLQAGANGVAEIASIIGALGGAAVLALFKSDVLFGWYATGLLIGFFVYFVLDLLLYGQQQSQPWRVVLVPPVASPATPPAEAPSPDGERAE
jgi:hypothetical protein